MKMENNDELKDEMREEYDFSKMAGGVRGKYAAAYSQPNQNQQEEGTLIRIDPDIAKVFPNAQSVNDALRALSFVIQQHQKVA